MMANSDPGLLHRSALMLLGKVFGVALRDRLSILIYHRVLSAPDPLMPGEITVERFRWQMALLAKYFQVLPLEEAAARLQMRCLPARAICVTFDDGYADNVGVALPVLREYAVPATFFIATGFLDSGRMWNDTVIETVRRLPPAEYDLAPWGVGRQVIEGVEARVNLIAALLSRLKYQEPEERRQQVAMLADLCPETLPNDLMMTAEQVKELHAAGMRIGAHTVSHPILAKLPGDSVKRELMDSRSVLENIIGDRVGLFAYPNGKPGHDYLPGHAQLVRKLGFDAAVTTVWGAAVPASDLYQLPRFTPWDRTPLRFYLRLMKNALNVPSHS